MFERYFLAHPRSVGESYLEHMASALFFARLLLLAGLAALVHAIFPTLFEKTASRIVIRLHDRMVHHRHRAPQADAGETHAFVD